MPPEQQRRATPLRPMSVPNAITPAIMSPIITPPTEITLRITRLKPVALEFPLATMAATFRDTPAETATEEQGQHRFLRATVLHSSERFMGQVRSSDSARTAAAERV